MSGKERVDATWLNCRAQQAAADFFLGVARQMEGKLQ